MEIWPSFRKKLTLQNIASAILFVLFIVTSLWGYGTAGSLITNIISPKYTPIEDTFLLPQERTYDYCVKWKAGQQYNILVSTDGAPINVYVVDDSQHTEFKKERFSPNHFANSILKYEILYKPKSDGLYWVILDNRNITSIPGTYSNRNVFVNFSVEASDICAN